MIVVDSSVWIDHFHWRDSDLVAIMEDRLALMHPFVLGEIALGSLRDRDAVLDAANLLPVATTADPAEVLNLIASAGLAGSGIGYVDSHLLASTMLIPKGRLWTRDRRLLAVAERLGLSFN